MTRAKNIWAALRLALRSRCDDEEVELDEAGERQLAEYVALMARVGGSWEEPGEVRKMVAWSRQLENLLADPNVAIDEIARQDSRFMWERAVCKERKSIRSTLRTMLFLGALSLALVMLRLPDWSYFVVGFPIGIGIILLFRLDSFTANRNFETYRRRVLTAQRAGDWAKVRSLHEDFRASMDGQLKKMGVKL